MKRVGCCNKRMSREMRKQRTLNTVRELASKAITGETTMTAVAKRMGLRPSTYMMHVLQQLWVEGKISHVERMNSRGVLVRWWRVDKEDGHQHYSEID